MKTRSRSPKVQMGEGSGAGKQSALGDNAGAKDLEDWRAKVQPDYRERIINHIMKIMKEHVPSQEIKEIAVEFEESSYSTAKTENDYLKMISRKTLMKAKSYIPIAMAKSRWTTAASSSDEPWNTDAGDWQEKVYQKIKSMKDMYLLQLNELYMKVSAEMQQGEALPQQENQQFNKSKIFKHMIERFIEFVQLSKKDIKRSHKEKLGNIEKEIISILQMGNTL